MKDINKGLLNFFTEHYKPGAIGLVGTNDIIGLAIREAQRDLTVNGEASRWSHCFVFGGLSSERKGKAKGKNPYIFENNLEIDFLNARFQNGSKKNPIGKWCKDKVRNAGVIDFGFSKDEVRDVLRTAQKLIKNTVQYPIQEFFGTWWAIVMGGLRDENIFDDPSEMFCSAFVRYCYREAGKDFFGSEISVSNTAPENIAQAGAGRIKIYSP